jgi:Arc/MetJ-type ribon-helix-helix transcriptional regulator
LATTQSRRVKVTVSVDRDYLGEVDRYVATHPGADRSEVFDWALRLWYGNWQEEQIAAQFEEALDEEQRREVEDWRAIRDAAAARTLAKPDRGE